TPAASTSWTAAPPTAPRWSRATGTLSPARWARRCASARASRSRTATAGSPFFAGRSGAESCPAARSHLGAVEVEVGARRRRAALALVPGAVLLRAVGVLRRRGELEEAELADL